MIEVRNVSFRYSDGTEALRNVSAQFETEHIFGVLGQSGSGKTTLLNCIARFLRPQQGRITLDGQDILSMPETDFRRRIGVVFQRLHLFPHLSVLKNMTLAPVQTLGLSEAEATDQAREMLERLRIPEIADNYPAQVSGGQAQRAAIARGLMLQPAYILLDEPTSALDANTTEDFAHWLDELHENTNFIIVTHDVLFARQVASRGIYMENGRIVCAGSIDEITSDVAVSPSTSLENA